jgi:hypothetical protein
MKLPFLASALAYFFGLKCDPAQRPESRRWVIKGIASRKPRRALVFTVGLHGILKEIEDKTVDSLLQKVTCL